MIDRVLEQSCSGVLYWLGDKTTWVLHNRKVYDKSVNYNPVVYGMVISYPIDPL